MADYERQCQERLPDGTQCQRANRHKGQHRATWRKAKRAPEVR